MAQATAVACESEPDARLVLPRRLRGIEVTRGIAALAVLVSHIVLAVTVQSETWVASVTAMTRHAVAEAMGGLGAWGVGLFFVLSGLCIHLPMARRLESDPEARLELSGYFARRFTRIYPPHLVALLLSAAVAFVLPSAYLGHTLLSVPTRTQLLAHLAMVHSFVPGAIFSVNSVLWTIALETHFYVLYPLLLVARRRAATPTICFGLLLVSVGARWASRRWLTAGAAAMVDQSVIRRYWEWALGMCLAEALVARYRLARSPWVTGPLLFATYVIGMLLSSFAMGGALRAYAWPLMFAGVLYVAARGPNDERTTWSRVSNWVGLTSYSLYLVHPIALAVLVLAARALGWGIAGQAALAFAGAWLATAIFFYAFERPFQLRASRADRRPAIVLDG